MIDENSSLEEVCFEAGAALDRCRIDAVLTGGSAAAVYSPGTYTSLDADFVFLKVPRRERLERALAATRAITRSLSRESLRFAARATPAFVATLRDTIPRSCSSQASVHATCFGTCTSAPSTE